MNKTIIRFLSDKGPNGWLLINDNDTILSEIDGDFLDEFQKKLIFSICGIKLEHGCKILKIESKIQFRESPDTSDTP